MKFNGCVILVALFGSIALGADAVSVPGVSLSGVSIPRRSPMLTLAELDGGIDRQIAVLGNIVMHEEISRYESVHGREHKIDEFDASVEMADGADNFEWVKHNGHPYPRVAQIPGAFSFGEFSTLLRISREAMDGASLTALPASTTEPAALVAAFHYPASSARWFVAVGPHTYWLDFEGEIRMSAATGDVLEISWTSASPRGDAEIRQIQRTVRFAPTEVAGEICILPEYAEYRVVHAGNRIEWNTARFKDPARYGSLVAVEYQP